MEKLPSDKISGPKDLWVSESSASRPAARPSMPSLDSVDAELGHPQPINKETQSKLSFLQSKGFKIGVGLPLGIGLTAIGAALSLLITPATTAGGVAYGTAAAGVLFIGEVTGINSLGSDALGIPILPFTQGYSGFKLGLAPVIGGINVVKWSLSIKSKDSD